MKKAIASPAALARELAQLALPDDLPDLSDMLVDNDHAEKAWEAMRERIRTERQYKPFNEVRDFERLCKALPPALRSALVTFDDRKNDEEAISMEAAYRIGTAVGRRLGGER